MKSHKLLTLLCTLPLVAVASGCNSTKVDPDAVLPENQRHFRDEEEMNTLRQVVSGGGMGIANPAPSTGDTRVLVLPISFTDFPAEEIGVNYNGEGGRKHFPTGGIPAGTGRGAENAIEDIEKTFFGKPEDTYWHSLASYYKASSYGKLNLNGMVYPEWIPAFTNYDTMAPVSAKEFADKSSAQSLITDIVRKIAKTNRYKAFKNDKGQQMFQSGQEFLKYFDSDSDGYVDLVEAVYSAPYHAQWLDGGTWKAINDDTFWAYCGYTTASANLGNPNVGKYVFQSYYTMFESGYLDASEKTVNWTPQEISDGAAKADAHTIIHESGHGLGLADYYSYDTQSAPQIGACDMMALNIGDHNSYSKSILGWTDPVVVKGPTEVTVKSFTETGECVYIPYRGYYDDGTDVDKKYKNTFNTEYIALELYNPTGVNTTDSQHKYNGSYPLCPSTTGLKIYHVDSRLGLFDYSGGSKRFAGYTSSIVSTGSSVYVDYAHDNTPSRSLKNEKGETINLIEYMYKNKKSNPAYLTNDSLYQQGDVIFDGEHFGDFEFNSGNAFGYKITVKALSAESMTLLIEAKK